jgi:hypothetical protein
MQTTGIRDGTARLDGADQPYRSMQTTGIRGGKVMSLAMRQSRRT